MEEYENMAAAVKLYYSILDYITEARQSRKTNLDVDKIFDAVRLAHDNILPAFTELLLIVFGQGT